MFVVNAETVIQLEANPQTVIDTLIVAAVHIFQAVAHKEYFAGYKFPINQYAVKSIQPYFMGDRLEYVNGRNYQRIDNGLGISFQLSGVQLSAVPTIFWS